MMAESIIAQKIVCIDIILKKNTKAFTTMEKGIRIGRFGGNNGFILWNILLKLRKLYLSNSK